FASHPETTDRRTLASKRRCIHRVVVSRLRVIAAVLETPSLCYETYLSMTYMEERHRVISLHYESSQLWDESSYSYIETYPCVTRRLRWLRVIVSLFQNAATGIETSSRDYVSPPSSSRHYLHTSRHIPRLRASS